MSDISKNIKRFRRKKQLTQEQLAQKLSVTRQTVSNWETDKSYPDLDMLLKLAESLETDPNALLYPESKESKKEGFRSVGLKPVMWTVLFFFAAVTWGSGPMILLLQKILGGGVGETFLYPLYWGVVLLAGLIVLCTCVLMEEIRSLSSAEQ